MAKRFAPGNRVEVQRRPGQPWEPAVYNKKPCGWAHEVELLGEPRRIDAMTGEECDADNPRGYLTKVVTVPARRIRRQPSPERAKLSKGRT